MAPDAKSNVPAHTRGKHALMEHYFGAWYSIVGPNFPHVAYFDGFAGPGRYPDGTKGSPLIALDAFLDRMDLRDNGCQYSFFFNELDDATRADLCSVLTEYYPRLPRNSHVHVSGGTFVDMFRSGLKQFIESGGAEFKPLVVVDPFGLKPSPMDVMKEIMGYPGAEILFTFMYDEINRFNSEDSVGSATDQAFGSDKWRPIVDACEGRNRYEGLVALYKDQLRAAGAKYALDFTIEKVSSGKYAIIFATKHERGCQKMKDAMWDVDPSGAFTFTRHVPGQIHMGAMLADFSQLRNEVTTRLSDGEWHKIQELEGYLMSDQSGYREEHLRGEALTPLKKSGIIHDNRPRGTRGWPSDCSVRLTPTLC